jgi:hypothetical protein
MTGIKRLLIVVLAVLMQVSCSWFTAPFKGLYQTLAVEDTATVIARRTYIRSSYAVVAADLLEVKRGDVLDILDETVHEKTRWYRVRAHDEDGTEGWIEAKDVIVGSLLRKSYELAEEDKDKQPQAKGQLRAPAKLRFSPEIREDNVLLTLEKRGETQTVFDIVSWKLIPKIQADLQDDSEVPNRQTSKNEEIEALKQEKKVETLEEKYDIWYKVRLSPSVSPAPAGWIFGRQVELLIPQDIRYYQFEGKRFVAWHRLDPVDEKANKRERPGSWVVLSRSNLAKANTPEGEPDFDSVAVFYYDKYSGEHTIVYRSGEFCGKLPFKVIDKGRDKLFTILVRNAKGDLEEKTFVIFKSVRDHLQVTPPEGIPRFGKRL